MKKMKNYVMLALGAIALVSCNKDGENPVANGVTLHFDNTFKNTSIVLGGATAADASANVSAAGQRHRFSELKYVISNIRLVKADGGEIPYHINDLDKGATVIDQSKPSTLDYVLTDIPAGEYKSIKFGLGVRPDLNTLDQLRFPAFYATAGANDTEMMWEWGTGYRFTKIEGFYGDDDKTLSIHTGSTVEGTEGNYTQGVDAFRDISLELPQVAMVGQQAPTIVIKADFDKLLSGKTNTITLSTGTGHGDNATPNVHTAVQMLKFVDNIGGNGSSDLAGMFSITRVDN